MSFRVKDEDKGFNALFENLRSIAGKRIKVGIQGKEAMKPRGETEAGRSGGAGFSLTMVELAAIHEFGVPKAKIPERSFLRSTADMNEERYQRQMVNVVKLMLKRPTQVNGPKRMLTIGEGVRRDIVNRMRYGEIKPELSEARKKQRGEEGPPLVDTGLLMSSIRAVLE